MSESISVSCSKMDDGTVIRRSKSSCRKLRDTSRPHGAGDAPRPATSETFADDHKGMKPYRRPSVAAGRQEVEQPAERCSRSSELAQSLSQCPHFAYLIPQPPTRGDRVGGVAAMLVVAVARPLGSPGSLRATVHPAAPSSSHGRRLAWLSRPGLGATPSCLSQVLWLLGRVHGVVRHFSPFSSWPLGFPELTMPTTPWAPEWICTCRTSTVCLLPRRCLSSAWMSSSWRRSSRVP